MVGKSNKETATDLSILPGSQNLLENLILRFNLHKIALKIIGKSKGRDSLIMPPFKGNVTILLYRSTLSDFI